MKLWELDVRQIDFGKLVEARNGDMGKADVGKGELAHDAMITHCASFCKHLCPFVVGAQALPRGITRRPLASQGRDRA